MTQLRNIQARTGPTIAALHTALAATGLAKVGEKRSWLMDRYKLGYGDANTVALLVGKLPPGWKARRPGRRPQRRAKRWRPFTAAPRPTCGPCTTR